MRFCRFVWPMNFGIACSMESFRLADTIDSLRLGSESVLSSAASLPNICDFEKLSEVISRGGTLEIGWVVAWDAEVYEQDVLGLVVVSTCGCDLLVDSFPELSAVPYRIRELLICSDSTHNQKKEMWKERKIAKNYLIETIIKFKIRMCIGCKRNQLVMECTCSQLRAKYM